MRDAGRSGWRVRAGDAVLTGVRGEHWPVQRHLFLASYAPVPPTEAGQDVIYRKIPAVSLALRLQHDLAVPVGWQGMRSKAMRVTGCFATETAAIA